MLGMKTVSNYVKSGKQFATFRLYEDMAVAREVQNELCFVDQKIYGIVNEYGISDVVFDVKNSNIEEKLLQELQTDFIHVIIHR